MKNLLDIFNKLNINRENGLFITSENLWKEECQFSSRIERLIGNKLKPDAFFNFDNKPLILFYDSPKNAEDIHKALWNFNESPIVIFAFDSKIEIFNGFTYLTEKSALQFIGNEDCLNDFNYFELVSGRTWEKYQTDLLYENRVDYQLLKNIKVARDILIDKDKLEASIANALIGKIIFVRYLIDRKVKFGYNGENKYLSNEDLCAILAEKENAVSFFKYLEKKFNGDMFLLEEQEYQSITDSSFKTIIGLLSEDDLGNGQKSLFKLYDFAIIPIEFISNVYESFIGNQEKDSAYYTPLFLVDYILSETVETYLTSNTKEYNCRVLDPACGSGIFLVETLRKIIEKFIVLNPEIKEDSDEFKEALKQLALDNIYGIDKNLSAIQVAIFSLQLTLLDYQEPPSIEKFKFPTLLNTNFFEADFFNTEHAYNELLKSKDLNFIIGNPPWKGNGMDSVGKLYLKKRKKDEKNKKYPIAVNNGEIAEGFVLRVSDFACKHTEISLIVRSSILYNLGYKTKTSAFRDYWMEEFFIKQVFELAPVRKEVFNKSKDPAIAPTAILFYKYANGESTDKNIIEHITLKPSRFFSLFKIFSLNRTDFKQIEQYRLKEYDWLWKTLVYGSYLDFIFINRLKNSYPSLGDTISDKEKFVVGTGIHTRGFDLEKPMDTAHLDNKIMIHPSAIDVMCIDYSITDTLKKERVHRIRDARLYEAPMLLVKKGIDTKLLKTKSAVSVIDLIFKDGLTSIKSLNKDLTTLQNISALLFSELYSYISINTFVSIGIEREQAQNYNKFSIPYINCKLESFVSEIEQLKVQIHQEKQISPNNLVLIESLEKAVVKTQNNIDKAIFTALSLNEQEHALIDYTLNVNRPIITKNKDVTNKLFHPIKINDPNIESYAQLFIDRFTPSLNTEKQEFIVDIWHSNQIIGMFFKIVPRKTNQKNIVWINKTKEELLSIAIKLSSEKITDKLFVQKDFRGFEKEFFYIFKPNEKRLWHKAIGYQDVDEFMDAILKTNRRTYSGK